MERTSFKQAIAVKSESTHTYSAYFPSDWCIGSVPHGGYITSVFQNVARVHFETTLKQCNQPHNLAIGLNFLRRTEVGEALFTVKDVKLGRQTSVIHVVLTQTVDGQTRHEVEGYITNTNLTTESGHTFTTSWALHPPPPLVDLEKLKQGEDNEWAELPSLPRAEFRKASQHVTFSFPRTGQRIRGVVDEWIRMRTSDPSERFTNESLGFVSDMWPQIMEEMAEEYGGFWYPTVLLNLDIKSALPKEGVEWLFVRTRAKQIKNGRYDLEIVIMDAEGELIALSNHIALVLSASRNLAKRNRGTKEGSKL